MSNIIVTAVISTAVADTGRIHLGSAFRILPVAA